MFKKNIGLLLVVLLALLIYFPSLFYHFVGDDYIFLNKIVTGFRIKQVFALVAGYFRPLIWAPYLLGFSLAGMPHPADILWQTGLFLPAYHFLNIVFHSANIILVYLAAYFIFKSYRYSILTALFFALHPINAEIICSAAFFGDLSFTFFSLLSVIFFVKFYLEEKKRARSFFFYSVSVFTFIIAIFCKETALCIPLLIILSTLFLKKTRNVSGKRQELTIWLVYFFIVIFYFGLRKLLFAKITGEIPWQDFMRNIPDKIFKIPYYLRDLISPVDLIWLKEFLYRHSLLPLFMIISLVLGSIGLSFFILRFRRRYILIFSLCWVATALIIPALAPFVATRRHLYFPLIGYSIFLVGLVSLCKKKYLGTCFLSLLITLGVVTTLERSYFYRVAGNVVRDGLFALQKELPGVEPDSVIYLVGIPGIIKNTHAFWPSPEEKIQFLYKNKDLAVFCLSVIAFRDKNIKNSEIVFLDNFTFEQSMENGLEEYIRVMEDKSKVYDGSWISVPRPQAQFKILKRDRFGNTEKVMFELNPLFLEGKKVYFIGYREGRMQVLLERMYS